VAATELGVANEPKKTSPAYNLTAKNLLERASLDKLLASLVRQYLRSPFSCGFINAVNCKAGFYLFPPTTPSRMNSLLFQLTIPGGMNTLLFALSITGGITFLALSLTISIGMNSRRSSPLSFFSQLPTHNSLLTPSVSSSPHLSLPATPPIFH